MNQEQFEELNALHVFEDDGGPCRPDPDEPEQRFMRADGQISTPKDEHIATAQDRHSFGHGFF